MNLTIKVDVSFGEEELMSRVMSELDGRLQKLLNDYMVSHFERNMLDLAVKTLIEKLIRGIVLDIATEQHEGVIKSGESDSLDFRFENLLSRLNKFSLFVTEAKFEVQNS